MKAGWQGLLADPELLCFLLVQAVPVAACSGQVFGPTPLGLMHCTLQLPHPGMAPVQLMLHLLNSSSTGMLSVDAHSVPMHTL